jgi:hypothetical protein
VTRWISFPSLQRSAFSVAAFLLDISQTFGQGLLFDVNVSRQEISIGARLKTAKRLEWTVLDAEFDRGLAY